RVEESDHQQEEAEAKTPQACGRERVGGRQRECAGEADDGGQENHAEEGKAPDQGVGELHSDRRDRRHPGLQRNSEARSEETPMRRWLPVAALAALLLVPAPPPGATAVN